MSAVFSKMKQLIKIISALMLAAALAFGAANIAFSGNNIEKNSKAALRYDVLELRGAYRNSSAVAEAVCVSSYNSKSGGVFSSYSIEKVLAGSNIKEGETISVAGEDRVGTRRILYLAKAIEDVHSENERLFLLSDGGKPAFDGNSVYLSDQKSIPISLLENDIISLKKETLVPLKYFYYNSIESVVKNCTSVFIGRVDELERVENADLFTNNRGEVIKKSGAYTELSISVLNGLVWQHSYGDKVKLRLIDGCEGLMIYEKSNEHFNMERLMHIPKVGDVCVFFVKSSPDEKAEHYFPVNPCQGMIELRGDEAYPYYQNEPFADISELKALSDALIRASGFPGVF